MTNTGIVEGFFGPGWTHASRLSFATFLQKYGGSFYIYAPKRDAHLRKAWREEWSKDYLQSLILLRDGFQDKNLKFGVALSPFGLGSSISDVDWQHLRDKFATLAELKLNYLGLFFDDMPSTDDLLKVQSQVVDVALEYFPTGLIFCPSYYTFDPILDKVFGQRPSGYVEGLKTAIPHAVDICWTGPKVISEEINKDHLEEVSTLLGRGPFIWENLYANDGPKNCKFLKLKYFTGRDHSLAEYPRAVGFNLMNQPYLSQLLYLSSVWVMEKQLSAEEAFKQAAFEIFPNTLAEFILKYRSLLLDAGLDKISEEQKKVLIHELSGEHNPAANEIKSWLKNEYQVGPECLTD